MQKKPGTVTRDRAVTESSRSLPRMAWAVLAIAALSGSGCSLSPGFAIDIKKGDQVPAEGPPLAAISVTPELVRQLRAERAAEKPAPIGIDSPLNADYRIGSQDRLHIAVWGHPDLSTGTTGNTVLPQLGAQIGAGAGPGAGVGGMSAAGVSATPVNGNAPDRAVDDDGTVFVPLAGKVPAVGLTVPQLRAALEKALAPYIHAPQVEVQVTGYFSQRLFVAGQVRNPGAVPITSVPTHVTDAIAQTGGALQDSDLSAVRLTRNGRTVTLDLDRLYYDGLQGANLALQSGDVLTVPDRQSQKIYVLGEVTAPKSYVLRRGIVTLAEALADAGGPNSVAASTAHMYVLRLDAEAHPQVYHLDGRAPEAFLLSQSFPVQAGDVVVVNPTSISRVSRLVNQFFPLLSETALVRSLKK